MIIEQQQMMIIEQQQILTTQIWPRCLRART